MQIQWLGHSCFRLVSRSGFTVVTDPFDQTVGYPEPSVSANLVTLSHDHFDHNHWQSIQGNPLVVRTPGPVPLADIPPAGDEPAASGLVSAHDNQDGRRRGANVIFTFKLDGLRLVHLGDLGHQLHPDQLKALGRVDVLFVPVGGTYTIDAQGAFSVCEQLAPRVVIPMHYRMDDLNPEIHLSPVEDFLRLHQGQEVVHLGTDCIELSSEDLAGIRPWRTIVFNYR